MKTCDPENKHVRRRSALAKGAVCACLICVGTAASFADGFPHRLYLDTEDCRGSWACLFQHRDGGILCGTAGWYCKSDDCGRTWRKLYQYADAYAAFNGGGGVNVLRLKDGRLLGVWQVRTENILTNKLGAANFYASFSADEGRTWAGKVAISDDNRRLYLMNDRIVRLSTGRIAIPFAMHPNELLDRKLETTGWAATFYSDDEGQSWKEGRWLKPTIADQMCEPVVFECKDGSLRMIARTGKGYLYQSESHDGGETWSRERPTTLKSPCAPFFVRKDPYTGWVFVAWDNSFPGPQHQYPRCPLSLGVSRDDGNTWEFVCDIENDPMSSYGYPSIFFTKDTILVSYYEQSGVRGFNSCAQRSKMTVYERRSLTVEKVLREPLLDCGESTVR